ncbi:CAMK family protein kinase [Tritrichomonas foetus]|uniref:CAMK family protein kinase n=1 Tax=Tritrichomonas foetus TaxID=1144522 RepID=A0A1J4J887_9EUKA|nr:CAMK family protein kinase [Tritrichomonas foetus]|eukprot:OHS95402.1 CAMK family protein kinase [Tritrichomonas foetus]
MKNLAGKFSLINFIQQKDNVKIYKAKVTVPYPPLSKGDFVALKLFNTQFVPFNISQEEIEILKSLNHKNVIKFYGMEEEKNLKILVMEYCEFGDLYHYIDSLKCNISEAFIQKCTEQIVSGLNYLHLKGFINCSINMQSILLTGPVESPTIKIADFSMSKFSKKNSTSKSSLSASTGNFMSNLYIPPEMRIDSQNTENADSWALAILIIEMITKNSLYNSLISPNGYNLDHKNRIDIYLPKNLNISDELREVVNQLLIPDPSKRLKISDLNNHSYFKKRERIPRFSFVRLESEYSLDEKVELMLIEARDSSRTIISNLTESQQSGNFVVFEILTILSEFLIDFLNEYLSLKTDQNRELVSEILEILSNVTEEGEYFNHFFQETNVNHSKSEKSGYQFLYEKGIQFARNAAEAEERKDENYVKYAEFMYKKSQAMLMPIVYGIKDSEFVEQVRDIYVQCKKRENGLKLET